MINALPNTEHVNDPTTASEIEFWTAKTALDRDRCTAIGNKLGGYKIFLAMLVSIYLTAVAFVIGFIVMSDQMASQATFVGIKLTAEISVIAGLVLCLVYLRSMRINAPLGRTLSIVGAAVFIAHFL